MQSKYKIVLKKRIHNQCIKTIKKNGAKKLRAINFTIVILKICSNNFFMLNTFYTIQNIITTITINVDLIAFIYYGAIHIFQLVFYKKSQYKYYACFGPRQNKFYNRSAFSAAFCVLRWVSFKSPSRVLQSNNYHFSLSNDLHHSGKRVVFLTIVKPLYPYYCSIV